MGRSPCCSKEGLNRGAWTASEDKILRDYINVYGEGRWRNLPKRAGLMRCGKSCRLRWLNYLRPDIKRGNISPDEEELIIRLHKLLGNRWSLIAGRLPGRTDNEIKNYWNTNLGRKINNNKRKSSLSSKEEEEEDHPRPQNESHAIRTRAVRCSKVFFTIPQPHKTRPSIVGNIKAAGSKQRDQADDEVDPTNSMVKPSLLMESIPYNGILEEDDLVPVDQDFLGNVHGCWEDLLINSDFMGLCDDDQVYNGRNNEGNDRLPPSSDGSLIFSKDHIHVLGDWIGLP